MNHLPNAAYAAPTAWRGTMTTKELRETLLATSGWVMAAGDIHDVCSKPAGAGVHHVWLEVRHVL